MSAFVVSNFHIVYMLSSYDYSHTRGIINIRCENNRDISFNLSSLEGFEEAANILLSQNYRSVDCRYDQSSFVPKVSWLRIPMYKTEPIQALCACDCYDYQACETPDYQDTLACRIISRIRQCNIRRLPGYDKAQWGLVDNQYQTVKG